MDATRSTRPNADRPAAWARRALPLVLLPVTAAAVATAARWPRWGLMWAVAGAIFAGCKWMTWAAPRPPASPGRAAGYWLAWPGMDAVAFLDADRRPLPPSRSEWAAAAAKLAAGLAILYGGLRYHPPANPYLRGWAGMVGLILCLHFGSFALLSCAWRAVGVDARPLMNRPLASVRLGDFWGLRWNTAFRDLTHRFLFRPLTRRLGVRAALWVGFLASGLVHDAVLSGPAGGGYGGPTLFFLVQPLGMTLERSRPGRRLGLGRGVRGWAFTMACLLGPAPLLFHRPFVTRIIVPFLHAIQAC